MNDKFRLETILKYRRKLEEGVQLEFSQVQNELMVGQRRLVALNDEQSGQLATVIELERPGLVDISGIRDGFAYIEFLDRSIIHQRDTITNVNDRLEAKRQDLIAAMKNRKVLEKLKERQHEKYLDWVKRSEAQLADDIVTSRYGR